MRTSTRIDCSISVVEGTALVGARAETVLGFGAGTGEGRWCYRFKSQWAGGERRPRQSETIAANGSRVYVAADDRLVTLALTGGTRCWDSRNYARGYASGIAIDTGTVFARARDDSGGAVTVLSTVAGNTRQELAGGERQRFDIGPGVAGGDVYLTDWSAVVRLN